MKIPARASVNWLSECTGKHQATIKKRISGLPHDSDGKVDRIEGINAIFSGSGSVEETIKRLNVAREEEIRLEMEIKRKLRIPIEIVNEVNDQAHLAISAIIKSARGKMLSDDLINDIFRALREIPKKLKW